MVEISYNVTYDLLIEEVTGTSGIKRPTIKFLWTKDGAYRPTSVPVYLGTRQSLITTGMYKLVFDSKGPKVMTTPGGLSADIIFVQIFYFFFLPK